jgi:hypothetical protein
MVPWFFLPSVHFRSMHPSVCDNSQGQFHPSMLPSVALLWGLSGSLPPWRAMAYRSSLCTYAPALVGLRSVYFGFGLASYLEELEEIVTIYL